jgi:hypothetical protein
VSHVLGIGIDGATFNLILPMGGQFELVNRSSLRAPTLWDILSNVLRA